MIHRHWLLYSILVASIALGGVAIAKLVLWHDRMTEENVRLSQILNTTMKSMQREIDLANRKELACRVTAVLIARESNGHKYAKGFKRGPHGDAESYGQWTSPTWKYARKRYDKPDYVFGDFAHQFDLMRIAILDNRAGWWTPCKDIPECRANFMEVKR